MRRFIYTLFFFFFLGAVYAQHNPHFTHFTFNKLGVNPAYAGSKEALTIMALYRHQWEGIVGAPKTGTAAAHLPLFGNRVGAGLRITSDRIGMLNNSYVDMSYAYRLKLKNGGTLSAGINLGLENTRLDWTKALIQDVQDNEIPFDTPAQTNFNVGAGLYYQSPNFYIGVSLPQLMRNTLHGELAAVQQGDDFKNQRSHYLMTGLTLNLSDKIALQPSILLTYVPNAPFDLDANLTFLFFDKLWLGGSYRLDDSADILLGFKFNKQWKLGIGYDYTLSELSTYSKGSGEILLEYTFDYDNDKLNNIRFF